MDGVEGGRNAAEHLLLRALARAGDNAAARLGRGMVPLEELQRMPRAGATSLGTHTAWWVVGCVVWGVWGLCGGARELVVCPGQ